MGQDRRSRPVVAIGDVNGAFDAVRAILRGVGLTDARDRWRGGRAHLVQVGDIFNRGGGARDVFRLLERLRGEAAAAGGRVTVLLGNHEVLTALGVEAYCTAEEYLAFATPAQRREWELRGHEQFRRLHTDCPEGGPVLPVAPRFEAWKILTVPGQDALRRAVGPRGAIGRILRRLPIAVADAGCVFSHAALTPAWARMGIDGLNDAARALWRGAPPFYRDLPPASLFTDSNGPLWNRSVTLHDTAHARRQLQRSLDQLGVRRMVVGHTPTDAVPGGQLGRIELRHGGKLVCVDVGLGRMDPLGRAALIIRNGQGVEWTPSGTRVLWRDRPKARAKAKARPKARSARPGRREG